LGDTAKLQIEKRTRDLALFNLAIDSKLCGCDLMALRVDDVAPNSYAIDRATVRQKKTGRPVRFELTELTRQALDDYLRITGLKSFRDGVVPEGVVLRPAHSRERHSLNATPYGFGPPVRTLLLQLLSSQTGTQLKVSRSAGAGPLTGRR
jgi:integrase